MSITVNTFDAHKNFGITTVTVAPVPPTGGITVVVSDSTVFPAVPFNATVWPAGAQATRSNAEIVRVTNIVSNTLTISRTTESSSARSITSGDQIAATITKKTLTDIETFLTSIGNSWTGTIAANNLTVPTPVGTPGGFTGISQPTPETLLHIGGILGAAKQTGAVAAANIYGFQSAIATNGTSGFSLNAYIYTDQNVGTSGSVQGIEGHTYTSHTSGTVALSMGVIGNVDNAGTATTTEMQAVRGGCQIHGSGGGTDASCYIATLTGRVGAGSGTYTNGYGLKVGTAGSGFTNVWGIHSAPGSGGNHYIQNHLCVGQTTTTHLFELATDDAVKPTTNTWTIASDRRLKKNIQPFTEGLNLVKAISPICYELNDITGLSKEGLPGISIIAQDVDDVLSKLPSFSAAQLRRSCVGHTLINGTDYLTWNSGALIYALINAVKELSTRLDAGGL